MMERLLDIEVTEKGTISEEVGPCCITCHRRKFLVQHT